MGAAQALSLFSGGGGYSNSTRTTTTLGPVNVAGLTFAPSQQSDTMMMIALVGGLALVGLMLFRKGR